MTLDEQIQAMSPHARAAEAQRLDTAAEQIAQVAGRLPKYLCQHAARLLCDARSELRLRACELRSPLAIAPSGGAGGSGV